MKNYEEHIPSHNQTWDNFIWSKRVLFETLIYAALINLFFGLISNFSHKVGEMLFLYFFTCIFVFPVRALFAEDRFLAHSMKQYAIQNNFVHTGKAYIDGKLVNIPLGKKRVFGTITSNDARVRAYLYKKKVGKHHLRFIGIESVLSYDVPNIHIKKVFTLEEATGGMIASKKIISPGPEPAGLIKLNFEHDFDDYFSVYTENNLEQEVYEIFTKDFMQLLLTHRTKFENIQIVQGKLYLFKEISNHDLQLKEQFGIFFEFDTYFEEKTRYISRSVTAIREASSKL